jgi:hypothetical protein
MNRFPKKRPAGTVGDKRAPSFPARQGAKVAVALAILAAIAGGCGGGNKSSQPTSASSSSSQPSSQASATASAWAGSFCGYAQAWKTSLQHASVKLKTHSRGTATAALNTAKSATLLFSNQLSVLGAPPGAGAQQATQQLRLYGQRLNYSNQNLQGEFNASSSTTSELTQKIRNVRGTLLVMVGQLQQAYGYITTLQGSSQLKQALTSNSTCRVVFGKT